MEDEGSLMFCFFYVYILNLRLTFLFDRNLLSGLELITVLKTAIDNVYFPFDQFIYASLFIFSFQLMYFFNKFWQKLTSDFDSVV